MFRVKAQEKQLSYQAIQEDIEAIQATASSLPADKSLCNATNFADGYADALIDRYQTLNGYTGPNVSLLYSLDENFLGYTMRLHRDFLGDGRDIDGNTGDATDTAESDAPHRILKIRYLTQSIKNSQTKNVTEHYVEIVPNAALQCP
ncbi:hypothetical protein [Myxosarcina sp. GI1(2024)]